MRIARSLKEAEGFGPSALTIGNFDGAHAGHRELLRQTVRAAREDGLRSAVLTFDPHPAVIVAPARAPKLLTTHDERCELMREQGIDDVLILPFTAEVGRLTPEEFVDQILVKVLGARIVLVGDNFRFGHRQAGDVSKLLELGILHGFEPRIIGSVKRRGRMVSSTEIRQLIGAGKVALAARLLERPYAVEGRVVPGHGIGAKQTVPTLNLDTEAEIIPGVGVYITRTADLDSSRRWNSITNVGYRPTFGRESRLTIETFLLEPALEGSPPARIRVQFLRRVRDEKKFENAEALKAQILRDVGRAKAFFRRLETLAPAALH